MSGILQYMPITDRHGVINSRETRTRMQNNLYHRLNILEHQNIFLKKKCDELKKQLDQAKKQSTQKPPPIKTIHKKNIKTASIKTKHALSFSKLSKYLKDHPNTMVTNDVHDAFFLNHITDDEEDE